MKRFWTKVNKTETCWLWTAGQYRVGYGCFRFKGVATGAHRVSWILHNGPIPDGKWVLHRCDVPLCVNPDHLFLGTNQDNVDDKMAKGREARTKGETNGMSVLTESDVLEIRALYRPGEISQEELGKRFGVSQKPISNIVRRVKWQHV